MSLELVKQTVAVVNQTIATTKYPNIIFPKCVTVDSNTPVGVRRKIHIGSGVVGDFDAGLITSNANAIPAIDVHFDAQENRLVDWVQKVQYNALEIEQAKALGIQLDTQKLLELDRFANNGLQKVAFLGMPKEPGIYGLLNNPLVQKATDAKVKQSKTVQDMTFAEAVEFFKGLFLTAFEKTSGIQAPDTILIDSVDLAALSFKINESTNTSALDLIRSLLSGAAGSAVTIQAIPSGFAKKITHNKTRALIYSNNSQDVVFDVPMPPTVLMPYQTNSLEYETGLRMVFGGVVFRNPASATYVEY